MPRMDGLTFLRKLMRQHPMPVVLCTDHRRRPSTGLEMGAIEVIAKPDWRDPAELAAWGRRLRESLTWPTPPRRAAGARAGAGGRDRPPTRRPRRRRRPAAAKLPLRGSRRIGTGSSPSASAPGGVQAIGRLLAGFPPRRARDRDRPAHAARASPRRFAERLDSDPKIAMEVAEARHLDPIRRGRALIVPAATSTAWSAGRPRLPGRAGRRPPGLPAPAERRGPVPLGRPGRRRPTPPA